MSATHLFPRFVETRLLEALTDSPAVLVHGPRQCGKTTLARMVGKPRGYACFTFDDETVRSAADQDPQGFVADLPERAILDAVQRVPAMFSALKLSIDRECTAGRFILTGSTNVLLLPQLADSLAGRMATVRLHPLAQCELARKPSTFLDKLLTVGFAAAGGERQGAKLAERMAAGGYPAALARASHPRRAAWYRDYLDAVVQRDVRDLARISQLDAVPRLLELAAGQTARLLNVSDIAGPFQLSRPTIRQYVTLLERLFLLTELPAWHSNRLKRLVRTPKLHLGDTGLAAAVLGVDAGRLFADRPLFGQLLETFVFQELVRHASWWPEAVRLSHYRDRDGVEVDLVLESGRRIAAVEIKAAATVTQRDLRGLRSLRATAGDAWAGGAAVYDGEACVPFGDRLWAVPVGSLWEEV